MSIEYAVIVGFVAIGYFLYTIGLEFKKEGNTPLYYLLFFLSTLMIPVTTSTLTNIVGEIGVPTSALYTSLYDLVSGVNLWFFWIFAIIWMVLLLMLFYKKFFSASKEVLRKV